MVGYIIEIDSSQQRQRPRNATQLRMGTFSNQASWFPHCGQRERGRNTERSAGQRTMQTFRNEPKQAPTMKAYTWAISEELGMVTAELVEKDSSRDGDVEGLGRRGDRQRNQAIGARPRK